MLVTMDTWPDPFWWPLFISFIVTVSSQDSANTWIDSQLVASNTTLQFNCTLPLDIEIERAEDLYFSFQNVSYQTTKMINEQTATLLLHMAQRKMTGNWSCILPSKISGGYSIIIWHQSVTVADFPIKPTITGCIVYNWKNMTCTWEPSIQDTGIETNQTLYWTVLGHAFYPCSHVTTGPTFATCTWPSAATGEEDTMKQTFSYHIRVRSTNALETVTSNYFYSDTSTVGGLVMPNPVKKIIEFKTGKNYTVLKWTPPALDENILYKITSNASHGDERNETNKLRIRYRNLDPYTVYTFTITCIPWNKDTKTVSGFWSKSKNISVKTNQDVPSALPSVSPGGFKTRDYIDRVYLYWKPVEKAHQRGVIHYQVRYWDVKARNESIVDVDYGESGVKLALAKEKSYVVVVDARTDAGFNTRLSHRQILISNNADMPPMLSNVAAQASQTDSQPVLISWSSLEGASQYTVYWCEGSSIGLECKGDINWYVITPNLTSWEINLDSPRPYKFYIFGVSAEFRNNRNSTELSAIRYISSGITWSHCTHPIDASLGLPQNMKLSENQFAESISVEWTNPRCGSTMYINKYIIYYCPVTECIEINNPRHLDVDSRLTSKTIEDLKAGVEYKVWLKSSSLNGTLSKPSQQLAIRVISSGLTQRAIIGICIAGIILAIIIGYGLYQLIISFRKTIEEKTTIRFELPPEVPNFPDSKYDESDSHNYQVLYDQMPPRTSDQHKVYSDDDSLGSTNHYSSCPMSTSETLQTLLQNEPDSGRGLSCLEMDVNNTLKSTHKPNQRLGLPSSGKTGEISGAESSCDSGQGSSAYTIPGYSMCGLPEEEEETKDKDGPDSCINNEGSVPSSGLKSNRPATEFLVSSALLNVTEPVVSVDTNSEGGTDMGKGTCQPGEHIHLTNGSIVSNDAGKNNIDTSCSDISPVKHVNLKNDSKNAYIMISS